MCVKLNSLYDSEMKVYYVTHAFKQGINTNTMRPNYILEVGNTISHLLQIYLGAWVIENVVENQVKSSAFFL